MRNKKCAECKHYYDKKGWETGYCLICGDNLSNFKPKNSADANTIPPKNVQDHMILCNQLNLIYEAKNKDYGNSFGKSFGEYGLTMACIRLEDKLNRFKSLSKSKEIQVKDESIIDTLIDLANYSIMTVMELQKEMEEIK